MPPRTVIYRLLRVYRYLRTGSVVTAAQIAEYTGTNIRTVYRDIQILRTNGYRILGDKGIGYMMRNPCPSPRSQT